MAPKIDIPLALIKTAAVSGIVFVWANFTIKAFKMSWHIISSYTEKEEIWPMKKMVVCEKCQNWNSKSSYVRLAVICIEKIISEIYRHV